MKYLQIEEWGISIWQDTLQVGAGIKVTPAEYLGRDLTSVETNDVAWHGCVFLN